MSRLPTSIPYTRGKRCDVLVSYYTSYSISSSSSLTCGLGDSTIKCRNITERCEPILLTLPLLLTSPFPQLLIAISSALPFLAVRMIYSILNAFSNTASLSSADAARQPHNSLTKFNLIVGDWRIYLVMSLLMEYIAVLIYSITGFMIPNAKEPAPSDKEQVQYSAA
jgi:hypothetical protein